MWPSVSGPENTRGATGLGRGKVAVRELFARTLRLRPDHLLVCQAKRASKKAPKTAKGTQEEPLVCTRMPVWGVRNCAGCARTPRGRFTSTWVSSFSLARSEEHTSELQSRLHLVCRLLLEK